MFKKFLIALMIFSIGMGLGHSSIGKTQSQLNTREKFISEIYDKIKENYWDNLSDSQLLDLFKVSYDKNGGGVLTAKFENKEKLLTAFSSTIKNMDETRANSFVTAIVQTVLASLNPVGRSGLLTTKQEEQLNNTVANINPQKDLYKDLGVNKGASEEAIQQAYQKKSEQLTQDKSAKAQEQLKQISYAKDVLTQKDQKVRYDQKGIEPTIFTKIIRPGILYFQFKKFSPTSYDEFIKTFDSYKDDLSLTNLIFDLRGNIGGAIDSTAYFLGNFIGKNQDAFDFYHKGEYLPFKTPTDKLPSITKYKQIVVLVDNQTQSSAEMMAASFKKYHIGVVLGVPTKGWGTVEKVFPIDNQFDKSQKYSLFLVHSVTLRDDNQPIEGRGVEPDVNINRGTISQSEIKNSDWQNQLYSYFNNSQLIEAVKEVL